MGVYFFTYRRFSVQSFGEMRKLIRNQETGKMRQIIHGLKEIWGDRLGYGLKLLRCRRNDDYANYFLMRRQGKTTFMCMKHKKTARSRNHHPLCPICRKPMQDIGMRHRIKKQKK
jgi:hypothetical protein